MSRSQLIRVSNDRSDPTVSFSPEDFNRFETARQISWQLTQLLEDQANRENRDHRLNLDFKDVGWISSAGLNELIGIHSQARSHGVRVVLLDVPKTVRDIFALTRLERIFEFETSAVSA